MQIVEQSWEWVRHPDSIQIIEMAGRTCYKSESNITPDSAEKFVRMLRERGHESVIEHATASVRFITDRGVTHELVRHRLCSFSQESTRYCNYGGDHISFIRPVWLKHYMPCIISDCTAVDRLSTPAFVWLRSMLDAERYYKMLLESGWRPEQARSVLPNSLKTEIIVTANLREWMHIFKLRCSPAAHPQIRELMLSCLTGFQKEVPVLFEKLV
jgi:thymidylate synthase (FAD)